MKNWYYVQWQGGITEVIEIEGDGESFFQHRPWFHISGPHPTREAVFKENEIQPQPCKECGQLYGVQYTSEVRQRLLSLGVCHGCEFWLGYVEKKDNPRAVRIDHAHYWAEDKVDKATYEGMLGFGGAIFRIKFNDGREVETNNLWHQGDIPHHFWERLPDNADFIDPATWAMDYMEKNS